MMKRDPDLDYGYHRTTKWLQGPGYVINHKKCRRLMKENDLLKAKHKKTSKTYVQYRKVLPKGPLEVLEMDIKMTWIERDRRHAFTLNWTPSRENGSTELPAFRSPDTM